MLIKHPCLLLLGILALSCFPSLTKAQNSDEEVVRIRTRVVFVDALVKDKQTGQPIADLTRENFEVFADGKPQTLTYFSRAGEGRRRPLALMLVVDIAAKDTNQDLRRAEVLESLSSSLQKLAPEDELAVIANLGGPGAPLKILTDFTRDRMKIAEALRAVRGLPVPQASWYHEELENVLAMVERSAAERPNSQIVVVHLSPVLWPIRVAQRDKITARFVRASACFSPLIRNPGNPSIKMKNVPGKLPLPPRPIFDAIGRLAGVDNYAPGHIAAQTGGEAIAVNQPQDYGAALEGLIASLAARYNLGFTLKENEHDDGRRHKLEIKTKAHDTKGKERKLIVTARRSYYVRMVETPASK
ncbi:MAG: Ca-activated chloride channel [Blastocatellia bacterium]|nr:Ca-activated chloride channel [Blastocatellia bacterium]